MPDNADSTDAFIEEDTDMDGQNVEDVEELSIELDANDADGEEQFENEETMEA
ncbi:MAG: hypothetical protein K2H09_06610 [Treponemataceae bacterium]|nr:hypothetical protein [Treponemataceae bacterium]